MSERLRKYQSLHLVLFNDTLVSGLHQRKCQYSPCYLACQTCYGYFNTKYELPALQRSAKYLLRSLKNDSLELLPCVNSSKKHQLTSQLLQLGFRILCGLYSCSRTCFSVLRTPFAPTGFKNAQATWCHPPSEPETKTR